MSDDELIEAIARAMFKDDQINRLDIAKAALDTCRPIIEAPLRAENAQLKDEIEHWAATHLMMVNEIELMRVALKPFTEFDLYTQDFRVVHSWV